MNTYTKFTILAVVILGTLGWLAVTGINETATYYKTVSELQQMGDQAMGKRLRVGGDVEAGTIVRQGKEVHFVLLWEEHRLPVVYEGVNPLPDTFRDGSQALADGEMGSDGVFRANQIQAKCASKYEAAPGGEGYTTTPNPAT